ncbi:MAG: hypothetical protein H6739_31225 [Alphaproteobacteria bacterium]|nr:hypothetical protein [Alphaproteobacteria bacterium]
MSPRRSTLLRLLGLGALAFALGVPTAPQAGPRGKKPPEPVEAVEDAPPTDEEVAEALTDFTTAITSGNKEAAMDALVAIARDPEKERFHGAAYASMGGVLATMDYPYASLVAYGHGIRLDPARSAQGVAPSLALAEKVSDTAYLEQVFSANIGLEVDAATRSRLAYMAARGSYLQGNFATAMGILTLVSKDASEYAQAQALKGVVLSQQGKHTEALTTLLVAQELNKADPERTDVILLNLARTYYASENWERASEYYGRVSRTSPWWPEAQFERAWAHFRAQDMNGTLSYLQNLVTPYYADYYFPEAHILRTYALFLMCKFPEASKQIDSFQATWAPVRDALEKTLAGMDDQAAFDDARAYAEGGDTKLPGMVLRTFPDEQRFQEAVTALDNLDRELNKLRSRQGKWAEFSVELLEARRDEIVASEGGRIRAATQAKVDQLTQMINDTELAKLDMLKLETRLYEQAAQRGELAEVERKAQRDVRVRKGYRAWPFEGEIWADEIGYYVVNATPECPEGLMQGN